VEIVPALACVRELRSISLRPARSRAHRHHTQSMHADAHTINMHARTSDMHARTCTHTHAPTHIHAHACTTHIRYANPQQQGSGGKETGDLSSSQAPAAGASRENREQGAGGRHLETTRSSKVSRSPRSFVAIGRRPPASTTSRKVTPEFFRP
jgi:hypothetical protein